MSEDRKDKGWEYLQNDGAEGSFYEDDEVGVLRTLMEAVHIMGLMEVGELKTLTEVHHSMELTEAGVHEMRMEAFHITARMAHGATKMPMAVEHITAVLIQITAIMMPMNPKMMNRAILMNPVPEICRML